MSEKLRPPPSNEPDNFLLAFSSWGWLMLLYAIALFLIGGILVIYDELKDQWIYAICVIVLNLVMFMRDCTRLAPFMRGGLLRLISGLARVAKKEATETN